LLVPYFRVALDEPGGETTVVSVVNAWHERTLAHVVVWTDWSLPAFGFFVSLPPEGARSINLRDVLSLDLPDTNGAAELFPGCSAPSTPGITVEQLQARLAGKLDPVDGKRYSSEREGNEAVGFLTVDVANRCDVVGGLGLTPLDREYFGSEGVAGSANVLWGDVLFVDPASNFASGSPAIAVPADAERAENLEIGSFYSVPSDRPRLPHRVTARFLNGGPLAIKTSFIVWLGNWLLKKPVFRPGETASYIDFEIDSEEGLLGPYKFGHKNLSANVQEIPFGALSEGPPNFGTIDIEGWGQEIDVSGPVQTVVWPVFEADGRYSIGTEATARDPSCREDIPY